jgi:hypothetical protein
VLSVKVVNHCFCSGFSVIYSLFHNLYRLFMLYIVFVTEVRFGIFYIKNIHVIVDVLTKQN